jgi:hypothetical protein
MLYKGVDTNSGRTRKAYLPIVQFLFQQIYYDYFCNFCSASLIKSITAVHILFTLNSLDIIPHFLNLELLEQKKVSCVILWHVC